MAIAGDSNIHVHVLVSCPHIHKPKIVALKHFGFENNSTLYSTANIDKQAATFNNLTEL